MTIGTDNSSDLRKRPIEEVVPPTSRKKQKTCKNQSIPVGIEQLPEKTYPFQKISNEIVEKCCNPQIELAKRKSAFFLTYLETLSSDHFIKSILHIIFYNSERWTALADCVIGAEEYAGQMENLLKMLSGQYDEDYLRTINQYTKLQEMSLKVQRLRFLGHIIGKLLERLPDEIQQPVDYCDSPGTGDNEYPTIYQLQLWFGFLELIPQNGPVVSIVVTEYRQALERLLLINRGYLLSTPFAMRSLTWQLMEKLIITLTNIPTGRAYVLSVIEKYVLYPEKYETKLFFYFLYTQRSSLRNCLNVYVITKPWFVDLIKKWTPQVIELLSEARIPAPDIQYNAPWKKQVRSIMQPRSMKGLKTPAQKEILSWSLFFATNIREFWYYLATNKCLNDYLSNIDHQSIKKNNSLQIDLFQNLIITRSLSNKTLQELSHQIYDFTQLFPKLGGKHLPEIMFRLCQHTLKDVHYVPIHKSGMSYPLKKEHFEHVVKREYLLMDSFFQILGCPQVNQFYPNAVKDLLKIWNTYNFAKKVTFTINITEKCLGYHKTTKELHHFLIKFIGALHEQDEIDCFIQWLWDEGLLDEEFASAFMSGVTVIQYPEILHCLTQAIFRNMDKDEILEKLKLQPITIPMYTQTS